MRTGVERAGRLGRCAAAVAAVATLLLFNAGQAASEEQAGLATPSAGWNQWRGPNYDGTTPDTDWNWAWPAEGPKKLWTAKVGGGFSGVIARGDFVVTQGRRGDPESSSKEDPAERVSCFNAATGQLLWKASIPEEQQGGHNPHSVATPAMDEERVYAVSKKGVLAAFDLKTGQIVWNTDLAKDHDAIKPNYGFTQVMLVDGVVIHPNAGCAFNRDTGKVLWKSEVKGDHYSAAVFRAEGQTGVVFLKKKPEKLVVALEIETGRELWRMENVAGAGNATYPDPLFFGNEILLNAGSKLLIGKEGHKEIYGGLKKSKHVSFFSPVLVKGNLYGPGQALEGPAAAARITCWDWASGEFRWQQEADTDFPLVTAAGDKLLCLSTTGILIVAEASPEGFKELARAEDTIDDTKQTRDLAKDDPRNKGGGLVKQHGCWWPPALAGGRIYLRNCDGHIACLDVRKP